jgi:hypothetical protein
LLNLTLRRSDARRRRPGAERRPLRRGRTRHLRSRARSHLRARHLWRRPRHLRCRTSHRGRSGGAGHCRRCSRAWRRSCGPRGGSTSTTAATSFRPRLREGRGTCRRERGNAKNDCCNANAGPEHRSTPKVARSGQRASVVFVSLSFEIWNVIVLNFHARRSSGIHRAAFGAHCGCVAMAHPHSGHH